MSEKRFDPRNKNSLDFMTEREYALHSQWWSPEANQAIAEQALADPTFDYFDHLPKSLFNRPKYQIGRYALKNGIPVPLVRSQAEWEKTFDSGTALLRSERHEDYTGPSGIDKSHLLSGGLRYPSTDAIDPALVHRHYEDDDMVMGRWTNVAGPAEWLVHGPSIVSDHHTDSALQEILMRGLRDGTVGFDEYSDILNKGTQRPHSFHDSSQTFSPWKKLGGINLSVMRDPVIDGRYYIGHTHTHHFVWRIDDGRDSNDLMAMGEPDAHFRAQRGQLYPQDFAQYNPIEYTLPVAPLIDTYEAVRTLPYFDQRQAPVMEMQYDRGRYHFLQYLKTNRLIDDPGAFVLPEGNGIARNTSVLGATKPEGERMRIYLDAKPDRDVPNEGFYVSHDLAYKQAVALGARAIIWDHFLGMKTNHYNGSFLTRPPVVFALWGGGGELEKAIHSVHGQVRDIRHSTPRTTAGLGPKPVYYIEANLTSNGREGTVESDWQIRAHDA